LTVKAVAPGATAFLFSALSTPQRFSAFSMHFQWIFHSKCEKFFRPVTKHLENVKSVLKIVPSIV